MEILDRQIDKTIRSHFASYRMALLLLGPRQAGKTTLLLRLFPNHQYLLVDNDPVFRLLETYDIGAYRQVIDPNVEVLIIDEIHLLSDPGRCAKIIYDQMPGLRLIITGSAALRIKNKTSESLAGRKIEHYLYPLTFPEYLYQKQVEKQMVPSVLERIVSGTLSWRHHVFDMEATLGQFLVYGGYPYLVHHPRDVRYLENLVKDAIFQDIIELDLIENRRNAASLLKLLAYQIGNLVNYSELANRLSVDTRTIRRYIEIFEQSFLIFRLYPFSRRYRNEISKAPKIYFFDTGARNAIIGDFTPLAERNDRGALFENFIISEAWKANMYEERRLSFHYWRTKQGSEVDLVISGKDMRIGAEIKYGGGSISKAFRHRYPDATFMQITASNCY